MKPSIRIGFPKMYKEVHEVRDFLPSFIEYLSQFGAEIFIEDGYGEGMGYAYEDYEHISSNIHFVGHQEAYRQEIVIVLRCPDDDELQYMQSGSCLISMLHYPTRPQRVQLLAEMGIEAISLDSLKDDSGRRLVGNLRAVAWNGIEVAMQVLQETYPNPGFFSPQRLPIRVLLLGAGGVGSHVLQAAIRYGDDNVRRKMVESGVPGVQVTTVDYDLTNREDVIVPLMKNTDLLVDATQRPDPSLVVIPNTWIGQMPSHGVILDLSVDPYNCNRNTRSLKGVEGIPQGDLDQYIFAPDDPSFDTLPPCVDRTHRRYTVTCYSWPGIHPKDCMEVYGEQLRPVLRNIFEKGGVDKIDSQGLYFERVIGRALLSNWLAGV